MSLSSFCAVFRVRRAALSALCVLCAALSLVPAHAQQPAAPPAPADNGPKKRVAVMDFDFATVKRWWGQDTWDIGKGIPNLLQTALVNDGRLGVVERTKIDTILQNQDFENGGRADPQTASRLGKLVGCNAMIMGAITQFGFDEKKNGIGGLLGNFTKGVVGGAVNFKDTKAIVKIDAKIVDATTGEILAVAKGKGESKRGSFDAGALGIGRSGFGAGGVDMSSSNFQETIIGEATQKCVDDLMVDLMKKIDKIVVSKPALIGKIASVKGDEVTINIGKNDGIAVGDILNVERIISTIKDPDTGKEIGEETEPVGTIRVTKVEALISRAIFTGKGTPQVKDRVKN